MKKTVTPKKRKTARQRIKGATKRKPTHSSLDAFVKPAQVIFVVEYQARRGKWERAGSWYSTFASAYDDVERLGDLPKYRIREALLGRTVVLRTYRERHR